MQGVAAPLLELLFNAALGMVLLAPLLAGGALLWMALPRLTRWERAAMLPAAGAGLALGLGAALAGPAGAYLGLGAVFNVGGWWDLPLPRFTGARVPLALDGLGLMLATPLGLLPGISAALGWVALGSATAGVGLALLARRRNQARFWPFVAATCAVMVTMAFGAMLAFLALFWAAAQLNFWLLLLATLAWHGWRHGLHLR